MEVWQLCILKVINWTSHGFPKMLKWKLKHWTHILKRAGRFILTYAGDILTKPKTEQKWVPQTFPQISFKDRPVANIYFSCGHLLVS